MSSVSNVVNPDLVKERQNASFSVEEFTKWFYDGAENVKTTRLLEKEILDDLPDAWQYDYLSYENVYSGALKQALDTLKMANTFRKNVKINEEDFYSVMFISLESLALTPLGSPLAVHSMMFSHALRSQGNDEQNEVFGRRAENFEIIGTYAQTEMGHGTFLRGLETRADFDPTTDEFVLNTPTITAYKWWPGGLGQTANYCIVVAQLFIDNQSKGIQLFVVQVRDEETYMPLSGIDIGDIGRKIAMLPVNNGFLGLKNVRIPRTNMLMKHAQVLSDGTFIQSPLSRLSYFPMVHMRCIITGGCSFYLTSAVIIVTRYLAVRRKSPNNPGEPEVQMLDLVTQQVKIFPEIATAIAYRLAAGYLWKILHQTSADMASGDYSRLLELHALACTLKASCTYDISRGIERLLLLAGKHGFLEAANLGHTHALASAACTYEGENSVLYLQVGKILMKTWTDVEAGKQLMPTMAYLSECAAWEKFPQWTGTWDCLVKAVQFAAFNKTRIAYQSYSGRLKQGMTQPEAVNNTGIELTQAAELHGRAFVCNIFFIEVTGPAATNRSAELNRVLENLLELYLVNTILRHMGDVLRFIPIGDDELVDLNTRLEDVLKKLRPDAVAICDGFGFHDRALNSVLGSYDGNVYERIFDATRKNPMNRKPVPASFEQYLKPFMQSNL